MIKLSILFVLLASTYQVQRQNPAHDNRRATQIVRYLRQQNPAVLQKVVRAMKRPAERLPWHQYKRRFVTAEHIEFGVKFESQRSAQN